MVFAPAPSDPFQDTLRAVTAVPEADTSAPHDWVIDWPEASCQVTAQPPIAAGPAVTVTSPWNPPVQLPVMASAAEQVRPAGGAVVGVVVGVVVGAVVGAVVGGVVGGVVVLPVIASSASVKRAVRRVDVGLAAARRRSRGPG